MDKKNNQVVTTEELQMAFTGKVEPELARSKRPKPTKTESGKKWMIMDIVGGVCFVAGVVCLLVALLGVKAESANLLCANS